MAKKLTGYLPAGQKETAIRATATAVRAAAAPKLARVLWVVRAGSDGTLMPKGIALVNSKQIAIAVGATVELA